jgi:hypothetical protein
MVRVFFLCVVVLLSSMQSDSSGFYIERTEAYADYGSLYILRLANQLVPPDKLSRTSDVECLVRKLKESGIFSEVQTELQKGRDQNRKLIVRAVPHYQIEEFVISEITLAGFPEVDKNRFQLALNRQGVRVGMPFLKCSLNELEQKITDALRKAYPNSSAKEDMELPWITIRPAWGENRKDDCVAFLLRMQPVRIVRGLRCQLF